jgi:small conductance mechanosensitive channel
MPKWITAIIDSASEYGPKLLMALAIFVIGMFIAKIVRKSVTKVMQHRNQDPTLISFITSMLYVSLQIVVVITTLAKLDIPTTSFVAVLGAAGLAIGLALQGSLSNFASGILMIIFRPMRIGDFVEAGATTGVVEEITVLTTTINTIDNKKVIVPNSKIMGDHIINFNAHGTRRVDLTAGIGYGDDIDKAKKALMNILTSDPRVLKDPAPVVAVSELGDSSVNFVVRPWVKSDDYWGVHFDTIEAIKKTFDKEGISIPFPQQDVHLYEHKK